MITKKSEKYDNIAKNSAIVSGVSGSIAFNASKAGIKHFVTGNKAMAISRGKLMYAALGAHIGSSVLGLYAGIKRDKIEKNLNGSARPAIAGLRDTALMVGAFFGTNALLNKSPFVLKKAANTVSNLKKSISSNPTVAFYKAKPVNEGAKLGNMMKDRVKRAVKFVRIRGRIVPIFGGGKVVSVPKMLSAPKGK